MPEPDDTAAGAGSAPAARVRVVLADDSVLFREGLARLLADHGFVVAAQAGDADELHAAVHRQTPDVVVTDIRMPPTNTNEGLLAAQRIRAEHPSVGVLVLSTTSRPGRRSSCSRTPRSGSATCSKTACPTSANSPKPYGASPAAGQSSTPR